jgi:hypothetical protein
MQEILNKMLPLVNRCRVFSIHSDSLHKQILVGILENHSFLAVLARLPHLLGCYLPQVSKQGQVRRAGVVTIN